MRVLPLLLAASLCSVAPMALAQSPAPSPSAPAVTAPLAPMDAAERKAVIEDLAGKLADGYVFPDVAQRYAAMLRANLAAGAYDSFTDPKAFAKKVTDDLQAVQGDQHLHLGLTEDFALARSVDGPKAGAPAKAAPPMGLDEAKMIGDVAYLRFSLFPDDPALAERVRGFLIDHQDAKAVIIDARGHHGGGLMIMDAFLPLLYAKPAVLVRMDTRAVAADDEPPRPQMVRMPSPDSIVRFDQHVTPDPKYRGLQTVPLYYLTSHHTGSAAEHLALALKRTHRAELIGETTHGAGHYGGVLDIDKRFAAFIPVGRTYDPDTNWDWEGKGVSPDVDVPADQALDKALELAKAAGTKP